jgi:hypothetical protein
MSNVDVDVDLSPLGKQELWDAFPDLLDKHARSDIEGLPGHPFWALYHEVKDRPPTARLPKFILGMDPGETTGLCVLYKGSFYPFQKNTSILDWAATAYDRLLRPERTRDTLVVAESYRIYSWKTKDHTWASLHTPRIIGGIQFLCKLRNIPLVMQSAAQGKAFMKGDDRLKTWGLHRPGTPHSNDATKHITSLLLFQQWDNL